MNTSVFLLVSTLLLVACAHDNGAADPATTTSEPDFDAMALNGEAAYVEFCAGCHETGMLGAPIAGDAKDWGTRSRLWDAVLVDHAITGYFEMPARGGRADLPDAVVKAAAEYMLRMTFPDMPHDCNPPHCGDAEN